MKVLNGELSEALINQVQFTFSCNCFKSEERKAQPSYDSHCFKCTEKQCRDKTNKPK